MKTNCAHCHAELNRPPSRIKANPTQFCGVDCLGAFRRRPADVACAVCGTEFQVKASRAAQNGAITCGPGCLSTLRSRQQVERQGSEGARTATCGHCGAAFTRKPSQLQKYSVSFCGRACRAASLMTPRPDLVTGSWWPCESCGKDVWRTPATREEHVFCSRRCAGRAGQSRPNHPGPGLVGPMHPFWKGGRGGYAPGFTRGLSRQIRLRDGNACKLCGEQWVEGSGNLVAHHVDHAKFNHDPANLVTLCRACHTSVHHGGASV